MKNSFLIFISSLLLMAGCDCGVGKIAMDSPKAAELLAETVEKNVDLEYNRLISAEWHQAEKLSNLLGSIKIEMVNRSGGVYTLSFDCTEGKTPVAGEMEYAGDDRFYDFEKTASLTLEDLDPKAIIEVIELGKEGIPETSKFHSLSYFKKTILPESGDKGNVFSIIYADKNSKYEEIIILK